MEFSLFLVSNTNNIYFFVRHMFYTIKRVCYSYQKSIFVYPRLVPLLVSWFLSLGASLDLLFSALHLSIFLTLQLILLKRLIVLKSLTEKITTI